jgi:O-antigen/teichoic acid export membrane protein
MTEVQKPSRSLASMITASLVAAVCGVVQTFLVPRLLTVHDYGYWRAFLLYASYAGLLHLGLLDGALLLWSRHTGRLGPDRSILGRSLRFLLMEQLSLVAVGLLLLMVPSLHAAVVVGCAFALYVVLFNLLGLTQVFLQAHSRFTQVALGNSLPGAIFVVLLLALAVTHHATVSGLLAAYLASWAVTLVILLFQARRAGNSVSAAAPSTNADSPPLPALRLGLTYIAAGWPIVLANTGFGLMQSADRVTVNLTRPIHDFAIYSLSQSTIYVPITLLAGVSRVAFSYFARTTHEGRAGVYRSSTRSLTMLWMLLLPYYFAVELVVQRFLPRYVPGLPAGRILLLSVLFLSLIQIVQMNTYNLEGRQRHFFAGSLVAVLVAFGTAWVGSRIIGTLAAVAWSQVLTAMLWWLANEYFLRARTGVRWPDVLRILAGFAASAILLEAIEALHQNFAIATALYTTASIAACMLLFSRERELLIGRFVPRSTNPG